MQVLVSRRRLAAVGQRKRGAHQRAQLLEPDRLRDIVEGARLERGHRVLGAAVGGDHRHRDVGGLPGNVAHQVESFAVGEAHVGQAKVVALLLQPLLGLGDGADRGDLEPHAHQRQLEQLADIGLVVDHQYVGAARSGAPLGALHAARASLITILKCAPGMSLTYSSNARLAAHSSRARYRPRPVPLLSVVKNGSNSWPWLDGGTPGPLSMTLNSTRPAKPPSAMRTLRGSLRA